MLSKLEDISVQVQRSWALSQLLLYERLGPRSSSSSSKACRGDDREQAVTFYFGLDPCAKPQLRCMLLEEDFPYENITAAHIYRLDWPRSIRVGWQELRCTHPSVAASRRACALGTCITISRMPLNAVEQLLIWVQAGG